VVAIQVMDQRAIRGMFWMCHAIRGADVGRR
jgi:hypothetical protein